MIAAIDTNIISALWGEEPGWEQLLERLKQPLGTGALVISPVVYTELHAHPSFAKMLLAQFLERTRISIVPMTQQMWSMAGDRYSGYSARRRAGEQGTPRRIAADFMIGAHATLHADVLMTNDTRVYKVNFPELKLV